MAVRFVNVVLAGASVLCLSLLVWLSARHGWTIHYLLLIVLAGILWGGRRLPISIRGNVALLVCSLFFSCYAAEAAVAFCQQYNCRSLQATWLPMAFGENASWVEQQRHAASRQHIEFDTRTRLDIIKTFRQQGLDAWPQIPAEALYQSWPAGSADPAITIDGVGVMPLGGIADKLTVYCNENGARTIYASDEYGFHNPKGLWQSSRIDVAAVGDSFVLGACVPSEKNFVALLRQHHPRTLNVGRAGNGPLFELASIKEYLSLVRPKQVLWFYFEANDLSVDLRLERRNPILPRYLTAGFSQDLRNKQGAIDRALTAYVEAVADSLGLLGGLKKTVQQPLNVWTALESVERRVKLTSLREEVMSVIRQSAGQNSEHEAQVQIPAPEEDLQLFRQVLGEAKKSVEAWGGRMVFVYLPQWERYHDERHANQDRQRVLETISAIGIPIIDIHPIFASHSDPLTLFPFRLRGHYTEEGNQLVAGEVLRFLDRSQQQGS